MTGRFSCGVVCFALALLAAIQPAHAVVKALDTAANAAYSAEAGGAWKGLNPTADENPAGNDNGGFGFLPWSFSGGYHVTTGPYGNLNHYIDGVDFAASSSNSLSAPAWALANTGGFSQYITARATRPFAAPMATGDVFSVELDTPVLFDYLDALGVPGTAFPFVIMTFQDSAGLETLKIQAGTSVLYGDYKWRFSDKTRTDADIANIAPNDTSDGTMLKLQSLSATSGSVTFDGHQFNIDYTKGIPAAVSFIMYFNDAGDGTTDGMGGERTANPTGGHEFFFDNLKIESPSIPGDFDGNGQVNAADLTKWKGDFGVNGGSDADNDADSDGNDQLIWQRHLGEHLATPTLSAAPEPTSLAIAGTVALAAMAVRRRAR